MEWKRFQDEDPYWRRIVALLKDRLMLIEADLKDPAKTPELLNVRVLQKEHDDITFMLNIPTVFMRMPDKEQTEDDS